MLNTVAISSQFYRNWSKNWWTSKLFKS